MIIVFKYQIKDILKPIQTRSAVETENIYIRLINSEYGIAGIYGPDTIVEVSSKVSGLSNLSE